MNSPLTFARSVLLCVCAALLLGGSAAAQSPPTPTLVTLAATETISPAAHTMPRVPTLDPQALTRQGAERYRQTIREYRCMFVKQERIEGVLRPVEEIEVRYREEPRTVFMIWHRNPDQARRVLFIDKPEFIDEKGRKTARVEPNGALVRLVVSDIMMPIHGERASRASRRTIDEFGFASTFSIFERYNEQARKQGVLDLQYAGEGQVDGRPTYVLVRKLPYSGLKGPWPERRLIVHIDKEWLLPTGVMAYADDACRELLGSYQFTRVQLNPGFSETDFRF